MNKEIFFREQYIPLLKKLSGNEKGNWGVLSAQGMIEHMTDSIGIAWKRITVPLHTPEHLLERSKAFMMSDKEFKPNTKNALMSEEASPLRNASIEDALKELEIEITEFLNFFDKSREEIVTNPFFGDLNYEEWLQLLHKHATHHLKQFNLIPLS